MGNYGSNIEVILKRIEDLSETSNPIMIYGGAYYEISGDTDLMSREDWDNEELFKTVKDTLDNAAKRAKILGNEPSREEIIRVSLSSEGPTSLENYMRDFSDKFDKEYDYLMYSHIYGRTFN